MIAPIRIFLKLFDASEDRSPSLIVAQEDARKTKADLLAHFKEVHHLARSRRTFDEEIVSVIGIELKKRANDQHIHRKPYGAAPVRISSEHPRSRFGGLILDLILFAANLQNVRMLFVILRKRAYPI